MTYNRPFASTLIAAFSPAVPALEVGVVSRRIAPIAVKEAPSVAATSSVYWVPPPKLVTWFPEASTMATLRESFEPVSRVVAKMVPVAFASML